MEQWNNRTKGKTLKNYGGVIKRVISGNRATMVEILWPIVALYSLVKLNRTRD